MRTAFAHALIELASNADSIRAHQTLESGGHSRHGSVARQSEHPIWLASCKFTFRISSSTRSVICISVKDLMESRFPCVEGGYRAVMEKSDMIAVKVGCNAPETI